MSTSHFASSLAIELIDDCYWKLLKPLEYHSEKFGIIIVPEGFETDLASVPRVPIIYEAWGNRVHREAVLHDFVYCYDSYPHLSFMESNGLFLEAMDSRNVRFYIKYPMYAAVVACGIACFCKRSYKDSLKGWCDIE